MKFSCEKNKLVEALSNVQKAVAQKSTIPALEGVLLTTSDMKISLCGYNTELGITTNIPAQITEEGSIVLNAHLFTEIIRKLPHDLVEITLDDKFVVHISSGKSSFELMGIDAKEFPNLPAVDASSAFELSSDILKSMIRQTIFSVAENDSKPVHTGTLFEIKNKEITLVSVDGYRMAMRTEPIKEDLDLRFVVPGKTLREVLRLLPMEDEQIKISAGMRHIVFEVGDYIIISRLLEGEFLDYKSTIPKTIQNTVKVSTNGFIDSIERVSLLITDRLKSPVRCVFSKDRINISCVTTIGKADDEVACSSDIKSDFEIAFNNKYMSDALRNTDCDEVEVQLSGALSPIKILPKEGNSFLFLVLPVRIKAQ
ncbi:MAG: DNA polymerase III subunit beta [Clostridia bacterium]|nr:DNA polymerase III subunit beta [Clostridia bacterium]